MANERIQLNIRMDNEPELYEKIKERASILNSSVNEFVINALSVAVGWSIPVDAVKMLEKINQLEKRVQKLEQQQRER
ncbi:hypothetical protein WH8501_30940 (plasmid) [Crocosphaera watsonii WH 8501]|uniref:hypothetical protein n=1 Tax=Crocosphaera watsonii TaxID=263511 RepID=UPI000039C9A8|nr:hypothetical protein [Crocosphaera watsonii]